MSRQNKKESIAALHRENILAAAEELFSNKGFATATMDDISDSSGYSRRTIYSYFTGKEDILQHIVLKGLLSLQSDLMQALAFSTVFLEQYHAICRAMANYQQNSPHSFGAVEDLRVEKFDFGNIPKVTADIFAAGTAINNLLAGFIESGKERGAVRGDIKTVPAVYILW